MRNTRKKEAHKGRASMRAEPIQRTHIHTLTPMPACAHAPRPSVAAQATFLSPILSIRLPTSGRQRELTRVATVYIVLTSLRDVCTIGEQVRVGGESKESVADREREERTRERVKTVHESERVREDRE